MVERFTFRFVPASGVMPIAPVEMREGVETDVGASNFVAVSVSVAKVKSESSVRIPAVPAKVTLPAVYALDVIAPVILTGSEKTND